MNDELRARLFEQTDPDHECTPYNGGCEMPHYRYNASAPRWLEEWPDYTPARQKADEARERRDWGAEA